MSKYTVLAQSGPGYWFCLCHTDHLQYTTDFASRFADWQIWENNEQFSRFIDRKADFEQRMYSK